MSMMDKAFRVRPLAYLLLLCGTSGVLATKACEHKSDARIEESFEADKAKFIQLANLMVQNPNLVYVSADELITKDKVIPLDSVDQKIVSKQWLASYKRLMHDLHLEAMKRGEARLYFVFDHQSFFNGDSEKGILLSTGAVPAPLLSSLDRHTTTSKATTGTFYKRIESNWYIYLLYYL